MFVGVIDGRLIALDAKTGSVVWETVTVDQSQPYTITGAPRVANGLVFIGNGGAEYGVRGYVSAYDAETRQAGVALLHRARRSRQGTRRCRLRPDHGQGGRDLERRVVEVGRRRHRLGRDRLRPRARPAVSSASATARRGTSRSARQAAATTCSSRRSSRSTPQPAPTSGTTRRRPARPGTTPPPSPSSSPTSPSTASRARW